MKETKGKKGGKGKWDDAPQNYWYFWLRHWYRVFYN